MPRESGIKIISKNRKAYHDYEVVDKYEAGIELLGTEVKSIRAGHITLQGGFIRIDDGQAFLFDVNIPAYEYGNVFNHDTTRCRRLLLHKKEIIKLGSRVDEKGLALIPLSVYLKDGKIKIKVGVCRGKTQYDKRETIKRKDADREARRAMTRYNQ
ncbi:MAG: SsrA-binding protein SmpB [Kiritimatiellae bacterium]|jgi:SsrA-binding protein|nr:SsrA-binding protein SmpB [Kiritimatiellia bacterium]